MEGTYPYTLEQTSGYPSECFDRILTHEYLTVWWPYFGSAAIVVCDRQPKNKAQRGGGWEKICVSIEKFHLDIPHQKT